MEITFKTIYFDVVGPETTQRVLEIARERAIEAGIGTVLVASTTGRTAVKAVEILGDLNVIAVSHAVGYKEPNMLEFTADNRRLFESKGGRLLTTTMTFSGGISRAVRNKFSTYEIGDIVAYSLAVIGTGVKVGCEMCLMAADSGMIRTDQDVITVAGNREGAHTAMLVRPANGHNFFDLRVREILCKPHF